MSKLKSRPRISLDRTDTEVLVTLHFKKMGKAARFVSKVINKPPKGIVKL